MKVWDCKIGGISQEQLDRLDGADSPMRQAVAHAYRTLTGEEPELIFSGWGGELTTTEQEVIEMHKART